jgi:hypothetical protein
MEEHLIVTIEDRMGKTEAAGRMMTEDKMRIREMDYREHS